MNKTKLSAITTAFAFLLSTAAFLPQEALVFAEGEEAVLADADEDGLFEIGSAEELILFADYVATADASAGAELVADIVCSEGTFTYVNGEILYNGAKISTVNEPQSWTPIGSEDAPFMGIFDGAGYSVSGLYYSDTDAQTGRCAGFISCLGDTGSVYDLTIENSYIYGAYAVGAVCGTNYGEITGCASSAIIRSEAGTDDDGYTYGCAGGISGKNMGTLTNCDNSGTVFGGVMIGGICGMTGAVSGCQNSGTVIGTDLVGGICGQSSGAVSACNNGGAVSGSTNVAGICGSASQGISNCTNYGNIEGHSVVAGICAVQAAYSVISNCCNSYISVDTLYDTAGGICAMNNGVVSTCYNFGTISNEGNTVGGICGLIGANGATDNCFNLGAVTGDDMVGGICGVTGLNAKVVNCFNIGAVTADHTVVGAVCGANSGAKATISGCSYNLDTSMCESGIGLNESTVEADCASLTSYEMIGVSARFYMDELDYDSVWDIRTELDENGEIIAFYPYLQAFGDAYAVGIRTEFVHGTTLGGGVSVVNANDATKVLQIYSATLVGRMPDLDPAILLCADYNIDGAVNTDDAVLILKDYANAMLGAQG